MQVVLLLPCRYVYFPVFGRKLESVGQQVVHHLVDIIWNEVHLHITFRQILQLYVMALGKVFIAFDNHCQISSDITMAPVSLAHCRFHLRYVQQLVDERKQCFSLPFYGFRLVSDIQLINSLQVVAQSENDGERCAELVGYVGEESLTHGREFFQSHVVALACPDRIYAHHNY